MIRVNKHEVELLQRLQRTDMAKFRKLVKFLVINGKIQI